MPAPGGPISCAVRPSTKAGSNSRHAVRPRLGISAVPTISDRDLIPAGRLSEVCFDDFEAWSLERELPTSREFRRGRLQQKERPRRETQFTGTNIPITMHSHKILLKRLLGYSFRFAKSQYLDGSAKRIASWRDLHCLGSFLRYGGATGTEQQLPLLWVQRYSPCPFQYPVWRHLERQALSLHIHLPR